MKYKVLDVFPMSGNSVVTVDGDGNGLKNNMPIYSPSGKEFTLLSVCLASGGSAEDMSKQTTVLVAGKFNENAFMTEYE